MIRGSLRRIAALAKELTAADALEGLHGNARRAVGRDLRKLGDMLADNLEGALDELGEAAAIIARPPGMSAGRRIRRPSDKTPPRASGAAHDPEARVYHDPETGEVRADLSAWEHATEAQKEQARARLAAVRNVPRR